MHMVSRQRRTFAHSFSLRLWFLIFSSGPDVRHQRHLAGWETATYSRLWLTNFDSTTCACPRTPSAILSSTGGDLGRNHLT
ncbi:hypothetical protein C8F04DRAFT_1086213 [Mycena alexandri]|uniref:Secreted protein n=1 Tax=Mycena alexandri TaxID=1745969 RepID=A0AAD6T988_9AGAR|nr:hypothetical protein C8F04DRAFT_1086213 [Mycena alexandri]